MKPPYAIGSVPSLSGHAIAYRWRLLPRVRRHRASKPQGNSERVLPWQITMDQLIFASLSHTHYWYEVGMLKVPAVTPTGTSIEVQNEWEENTHTHSPILTDRVISLVFVSLFRIQSLLALTLILGPSSLLSDYCISNSTTPPTTTAHSLALDPSVPPFPPESQKP